MRCCVIGAWVVLLVARHAHAQSTAPSAPRADRVVSEGAPGAGPEQAAAHEHFERALTWYRAGKYHSAVAELSAALQSDPHGKDLVFNLALVQEKLGDLAGAIQSLELFRTMEKDPAELERAAQSIQRLQGARAELTQAGPRAAAALAAPCASSRSRGKFDGWVIGAGSFALASFVAGAVLGIRALTLDAPSDQRQARNTAVMADFSLATSLLAGVGAAALYFGRYNDVQPEHAAVPVALPRVSAAWLVLRY